MRLGQLLTVINNPETVDIADGPFLYESSLRLWTPSPIPVDFNWSLIVLDDLTIHGSVYVLSPVGVGWIALDNVT